MSKWVIKNCSALHDPVTGALAGLMGFNGVEYLFASTSSTSQPTLYSPSGVAITGGTINGATIGVTTAAIVKTSNLQATYTDSSATPGNVTNSSPRGRAAFAAAGSSVVVTSTLVTATSTVLASLAGGDATLTGIRVTPGAGSFTVTGNAAATAITKFDFLVVN